MVVVSGRPEPELELSTKAVFITFIKQIHCQAQGPLSRPGNKTSREDLEIGSVMGWPTIANYGKVMVRKGSNDGHVKVKLSLPDI